MKHFFLVTLELGQARTRQVEHFTGDIYAEPTWDAVDLYREILQDVVRRENLGGHDIAVVFYHHEPMRLS